MKNFVDESEVVELTKALVSINTVNPPGNESEMESALHRALDPWNPSWSKVEPENKRTSFIADLGTSGKPRLIVNGHLDVVPVDLSKWTEPPFSPTIKDGRLYARGSADMKGGIAAAICALSVVKKSGRDLAWDISFHLVADEELGGALGSGVLAKKNLIKGDACLVPEPTSLDISVAERGLVHGRIQFHGIPAHGSRPELGISAIEHAAAAVLALQSADFGEMKHHLLGKPTLNIGTIQGGSAPNIVAGACEVGFDRRLIPGTTLDDAIAQIRQKLDSLGIKDLDYSIEIDKFGEPSEMPATDSWVSTAGKAMETSIKKTPSIIGMPFTTDARFVRNQAGIPTVVCGPGNIDQAHGNDEYVDIDSLVDATAFFAELYCTAKD